MGLQRALIAGALGLLVALVPAKAGEMVPADAKQAAPEAATGATVKPLAIAHRHMVVAANPYAAEAGRDILRAGGSAVDAAIAMQMVLNLVEPQSSGIGGGAFIVTYNAKTKSIETCLLYTSPSPRDGLLSRMPSSA